MLTYAYIEIWFMIKNVLFEKYSWRCHLQIDCQLISISMCAVLLHQSYIIDIDASDGVKMLTHLPLDKIAAVSHPIFSDVFCE